MRTFNIQYGLGGGFGINYKDTIEENSYERALDTAEIMATDIYQSYGGMHGLFNFEEALEEDPTLTEEDLAEMEQDDIDSWITFSAEEVK